MLQRMMEVELEVDAYWKRRRTVNCGLFRSFSLISHRLFCGNDSWRRWEEGDATASFVYFRVVFAQ